MCVGRCVYLKYCYNRVFFINIISDVLTIMTVPWWQSPNAHFSFFSIASHFLETRDKNTFFPSCFSFWWTSICCESSQFPKVTAQRCTKQLCFLYLFAVVCVIAGTRYITVFKERCTQVLVWLFSIASLQFPWSDFANVTTNLLRLGPCYAAVPISPMSNLSMTSGCDFARWLRNHVCKQLDVSISASRCDWVIRSAVKRQIVSVRVCKIFLGNFWWILCLCVGLRSYPFHCLQARDFVQKMAQGHYPARCVFPVFKFKHVIYQSRITIRSWEDDNWYVSCVLGISDYC